MVHSHKRYNCCLMQMFSATLNIDGTGTGLDFGPAGLPVIRRSTGRLPFDRSTGRLPFEQPFAV